MKNTIKHLSDTKVELTITVTKDELAEAKQIALTRLARDVKVEGFRKGKAPLSAVEKHLAPQVLQDEILNNALNKTVAAAFLEEKLQLLDRPSVDVKKYVPDETLEFTATVEILPKITLGNYKKLKTKLPKNGDKVTVSEKEVDEIIDRMSQGVAKKEVVKRAAKLGDEVLLDFVGKKDGIAFDGGTGTDYTLKLGSNTFIPGFEEGIVGKKAGETFDLDLKFPSDYHVADLKGAKVVFTTTLKTVNEVQLPEMNDALVAKVGPFKTIKEMRDDIRRELTEKKAYQAKEELKEALVNELINVSKIPLPEVLVDDQAKSIERDFEQNLTYQGITTEQYMQNKGFKGEADWRDKEVKPAAVKRVKAGLVLAELSKVENIEANKDEIQAHIELYKKQYGSNPEALKQFESPEVQREIANRLITEKTVDRLVELNTK